MVVRKRLDHLYGMRGRPIRTIPCVPNLARGKHSTRIKKNEMYAFELLATVAGTLLADQDNSSNVPNISEAAISYARNRKSVKEERFDEILPLNMEKDCCCGCVMGSGVVCAFPRQANDCLAKNSLTRNEAESVLESLTVKSNMLVSCTKQCETSRGLGMIPDNGAYGIRHPESSSSAEAKQVQQTEPTLIRRQADGHAAALNSLFDSVDLDGRPALVSSDSSSGARNQGTQEIRVINLNIQVTIG